MWSLNAIWSCILKIVNYGHKQIVHTFYLPIYVRDISAKFHTHRVPTWMRYQVKGRDLQNWSINWCNAPPSLFNPFEKQCDSVHSIISEFDERPRKNPLCLTIINEFLVNILKILQYLVSYSVIDVLYRKAVYSFHAQNNDTYKVNKLFILILYIFTIYSNDNADNLYMNLYLSWNYLSNLC